MEFNFDFSSEKNEKLILERDVSFYTAIESIIDHGIMLDFEHPNKEKYPNQRMFVVEINSYTYCVPYVIDGNKYFLKTVYQNRDFMFLLDKETNDVS